VSEPVHWAVLAGSTGLVPQRIDGIV